jgi:hypothetical protein
MSERTPVNTRWKFGTAWALRGPSSPTSLFLNWPRRCANWPAETPDWHIEECALDREAGPATFHIMAADVFSSLNRPADDQPAIFDGMNYVAREVEVMRSTLAIEAPRWREKLNFRRPFLKLRAQGSDLAVVLGAGESIKAFVGLQSELPVRKIYAGSSSFGEMLATYEERGFELSAFTQQLANTASHFPTLLQTDCIMFRRDAERIGAAPA